MVYHNKPPKSALEYYVYLYTLKIRKESSVSKVKKKDLITEATVSWLKLNTKKRQIITTRFQSQQLKLKKNFADRLRNVYMSKKILRGVDENYSISNSFTNISKANSEIEDFTQDNKTITSSTLMYEHENKYESERHENSSIQQFPALMLEPTPPAFRTNKELYDLMNRDSENVLPWNKLSRGIKGQYERAATRIRRNYIMSYTSFLESLTPTELFNHYKNVTNI